MACYIYYQRSKKGSSQPTSEEDCSTTAAYYGVSLYFTLFVLCLDIAALHYRRIGAEFILISNDDIKNLVFVPLALDFLAVAFIVALSSSQVNAYVAGVVIKRVKRRKDTGAYP